MKNTKIEVFVLDNDTKTENTDLLYKKISEKSLTEENDISFMKELKTNIKKIKINIDNVNSLKVYITDLFFYNLVLNDRHIIFFEYDMTDQENFLNSLKSIELDNENYLNDYLI